MGGKKNDNKEKNKNKKDKNKNEDEEQKGRQNKRKEKRHKQKNWQDSDEFVKHLKEFNEEVSKYNLYIRDVQGDGNCLFRSVADQLEGDENMHVYYRKVAVEQMKKQADFFKNFVFDVDFDNYLNEMSSLCTWGGNLEIQALSAALGHNFIIHMKGRPYLAIKGKAVKNIKKRTIHLAYHTEDDSEEHYSSIRNIGDDEKEQPAQQIKNEMFRLLEKQMNKDDGIEQNDEEEEEDLNIKENSESEIIDNQESALSTQKKGSKQKKIDIAKEKKEKLKAKKASTADKKENKQPEKTHKKKQKQPDQNEEEENSEEDINISDKETDSEEEQDNGQQSERLNQEIIKRKEEKQIKDMIKQAASMHLNDQKKDQNKEKEQNISKVGRNQKCYCGSLKTYKKCCEAKDEGNKKEKKKEEQKIEQSIKEVVFI